jgi:hypothetical protein
MKLGQSQLRLHSHNAIVLKMNTLSKTRNIVCKTRRFKIVCSPELPDFSWYNLLKKSGNLCQITTTFPNGEKMYQSFPFQIIKSTKKYKKFKST